VTLFVRLSCAYLHVDAVRWQVPIRQYLQTICFAGGPLVLVLVLPNPSCCALETAAGTPVTAGFGSGSGGLRDLDLGRTCRGGVRLPYALCIFVGPLAGASCITAAGGSFNGAVVGAVAAFAG
jgi:hypothetical protein